MTILHDPHDPSEEHALPADTSCHVHEPTLADVAVPPQAEYDVAADRCVVVTDHNGDTAIRLSVADEDGAIALLQAARALAREWGVWA